MQAAPLPTCGEYDALDAHLDELEEPGARFLQDFMAAPQAPAAGGADGTPMSNGYTSEESDYSVATPSDEQMFQDVSFLPADTDELVEVVADFCTNDDLTALTPQQQQKFGGKVIKGKVRGGVERLG